MTDNSGNIPVKHNARAFSRLGMAGAVFGSAAPEMHAVLPLVCLSADMSTPAGLDRFKRLYPSDFYNVGIAEQNLIGVAAGLASEGYLPVCVTQAAFITMRACEQLRQYLGYMRLPVIAVGLSAGFALSFLGNTHYAIEDLAITRAIPGLDVYSPADAGAAVKIFCHALTQRRPAYIRLTAGLMTPIVYKDDYLYNPARMRCVADHGGDAVVYATGSVVYHCIKAAEILAAEGIACKVYDVSRIKPLDDGTILENAGIPAIFTVEEHNIVGGLGSAVAETLSSLPAHSALTRIGVEDSFSEVGEYAWLLERHGLTTERIADRIKNTLCRL